MDKQAHVRMINTTTFKLDYVFEHQTKNTNTQNYYKLNFYLKQTKIAALWLHYKIDLKIEIQLQVGHMSVLFVSLVASRNINSDWRRPHLKTNESISLSATSEPNPLNQLIA